MGHGRLYRFECAGCGAEYIAVGAEWGLEAVKMARANGWERSGVWGLHWRCPDCRTDPAPDSDPLAACPGDVRHRE